MWICEAPDKARVAALADADPFTVHGVRSGYRIHAWSKASFYGDVTL